ncbi:hypothetical protein ABZ467_38450 [Streptomyces sp. NPDC005727]|uniref:hypothetical protein n=1 Tax=Streptomyces sp. NPDC005727 TaxID=3157053 RepID=UPI0033CAB75D
MEITKEIAERILPSIDIALSLDEEGTRAEFSNALSNLTQLTISVKNDHFKSLAELKECEIEIEDSKRRLTHLDEKARRAARQGERSLAEMYVKDKKDVLRKLEYYQGRLRDLQEETDYLRQQKEILARAEERIRRTRQEVMTRKAQAESRIRITEARKHLKGASQRLTELDASLRRLRAYGKAEEEEGNHTIGLEIEAELRAEHRWVEEELRRLTVEQ